jgi:hypothetical protein
VLKEIIEGTLKSVNLGDLTKGVTEGLKNASTNTVDGATKKIGDLFKKK